MAYVVLDGSQGSIRNIKYVRNIFWLQAHFRPYFDLTETERDRQACRNQVFHLMAAHMMYWRRALKIPEYVLGHFANKFVN